MGKDLMNPKFGPRYMKYSDEVTINGNTGGIYTGELSVTTNRPHGRGIHMKGDTIHIGYFKNGSTADSENMIKL